MATEVLFLAEQVGSEYRGLVIDAKTYQAILITAHNYCSKTVAECAARAMYAERQEMAA